MVEAVPQNDKAPFKAKPSEPDLEDDIAEEITEPDTYDEGESDNPMTAVEDAIDTYGRFPREPDGSVEFDHFLALKEIIHR